MQHLTFDVSTIGSLTRLVTKNSGNSDSSRVTAGRLEVFYSGKRGSVCSEGFTQSDAEVFCYAVTGSTTTLRYGSVSNGGLK